jgi:hypothetical protein
MLSTINIRQSWGRVVASLCHRVSRFTLLSPSGRDRRPPNKHASKGDDEMPPSYFTQIEHREKCSDVGLGRQVYAHNTGSRQITVKIQSKQTRDGVIEPIYHEDQYSLPPDGSKHLGCSQVPAGSGTVIYIEWKVLRET